SSNVTFTTSHGRRRSGSPRIPITWSITTAKSFLARSRPQLPNTRYGGNVAGRSSQTRTWLGTNCTAHLHRFVSRARRRFGHECFEIERFLDDAHDGRADLLDCALAECRYDDDIGERLG